MYFKTHYDNTPDMGEINSKPSQTIPGQNLTVREIMVRFSQGLGWEGAKVGTYDNGTDPLEGLDLHKLDLSERAELLQDVNQRIVDLRHEMAENLKKKPKPLTPEEIQKLRDNQSQAPQATIQPDDHDKPPAQSKGKKSKDGQE